MAIPHLRLSQVNDAPIIEDGEYVLYWMITQRRTRWNFALDHAVHRALELGKPLVVLEALRCGYPWASDRLHRFVLEGMADNAARLHRLGVPHFSFVETTAGEGAGLLEALATRACVVVTDEFPCFFLPRMVAAAGERLAETCRLEQVDGNGLLPLRQPDKTFLRAVDLRRHLQKVLAEHLLEMPSEDPLTELDLPECIGFPKTITSRWTNSAPALAKDRLPDLSDLPINHSVPPVNDFSGGESAGQQLLERFLDQRLARYDDDRRNLDDRASSELSAHLHFGHVGVHQVLCAVAGRYRWHPALTSGPLRGRRVGWWGLPEPAESFLDEIVTWRELGYNMCFREDGYDRYESLASWARETIEAHLGDKRDAIYDLETFEHAQTHDDVWNAAQRELVREGRIHNYLRMLWGKKIFEWSETPRDALAVMIELNNKYALDGRNPNSYSGIFWVLGRYDRPWGPERPVYGKIRYMSSEQARKKLDMRGYLVRYGPD
ncbi:MAG: deoxyribodipyrimidine photolyase [Thermoanaerobaculia bacterium]|nr:deoxyribodipyrimidine photolyase [Thermoanaerobaculia bacterium]